MSTSTDQSRHDDAMAPFAWVLIAMLGLCELGSGAVIIHAELTPYNSLDTTFFELGLTFLALIAFVGGIVQAIRDRGKQALALLALFFAPFVLFCVRLMQ